MTAKFLLLLASSVAFSGCDMTDSATDAKSESCAVAQAFITQELSKGEFALDDSPVQGSFGWQDLAATQHDTSKSRPSSQLLSGLTEGYKKNLVSHCPVLVQRIKKAGTKVGGAAVDAIANSEDASGLYPAEIVSLSLPVVSKDGQSAVMIVDSVVGSEAGGGAIYYLRRGVDGDWQVVDWWGTWIS